jgi:hypothetical protein
MDIDNINRIDVEQIGNIVINHDHIQAFSKSIPVIYRGTKDDVDEWKSANERPTKYLLTIIQNTMPYNIYAVPKAQYFNNEIVYRPYTYVGPPITKPFLDKMNTIVKQIKNNADNIVNSSQDLIYQFKNNILVNIYDEHIKYQIIKSSILILIII